MAENKPEKVSERVQLTLSHSCFDRDIVMDKSEVVGGNEIITVSEVCP
jgi:hypothetical protein